MHPLCGHVINIYICYFFLKYIKLSLIPVTMRLSVLHLLMFSRLLYSVMYSSWLLGNDFRALLEFSNLIICTLNSELDNFHYMHSTLQYPQKLEQTFRLVPVYLLPCMNPYYLVILFFCSYASSTVFPSAYH